MNHTMRSKHNWIASSPAQSHLPCNIGIMLSRKGVLDETVRRNARLATCEQNKDNILLNYVAKSPIYNYIQ